MGCKLTSFFVVSFYNVPCGGKNYYMFSAEHFPDTRRDDISRATCPLALAVTQI